MEANLASKVLEHYLGRHPDKVQPLPGGKTNFVFEVNARDERYVARISEEPSRLEDYLKEQWAVTKARERGVPTPEILHVGTEPIGMPYMILRRVEGRPAVSQPHSAEVFREMGFYASRINAISTVSFGHFFDWCQSRRCGQKSWSEYLHEEYKASDRVRLLEQQGLVSTHVAGRLREELALIEQWSKPPNLNHGDLRLKNILLDSEGRIAAILDWEKCLSQVAPYWELSIALHDLSIDDKEAFLEGYGLNPANYALSAPAVRFFNILNYSTEASQAAEQGDHPALERLRMRLSGSLDLFSL